MMRFTMVLAEIRSGFPGFSGFYSEGVASLTAILKEQNHSVTLIHITHPEDPSVVASKVAATKPDVIGYSSMTHTFHYVREYAETIKRNYPHIPSILGGVHAILNPEECLASNGFDAVCTGEGEIPLPIFIQRIEKKQPWNDIPGIWTKNDGIIFRNISSPVITNLDSLPSPDRSIFPVSQLMTAREGVMYAYASRGCPFDCSFCCNAALQYALPASTPAVRMKSVHRVCKEIASSEEFQKKKLCGIYFQDDIFPLSKIWLDEFSFTYPKQIGIPFNCNLRADVVTNERAQMLRSSGCVSVSIGVESGVDALRASILGKNITHDQFEKAFSILHHHGIRINTFSMVGLPDETCDSALETVRFNSHPAVNNALCSIFFPYFGTELHRKCLAKGILTEKMSDTYQQTTVLRQQSIAPSQVEFIHDFFGALTTMIRQFGEESLFVRTVFLWIRNGDISLKIATQILRFFRSILILPYLTVGKYFVNRQKKVFG